MKVTFTDKAIQKAQYYMSLAYMVAMQSKDPRTWIGAVIVGPDQEIRSTGYNGLPRGCSEWQERLHGDEKYFWFEHGERNAIYNAARMGLSVKDCTMFTQGTPCADCARAIIQSGIRTVVVHKAWDNRNTEKWAESAKRSKVMFSEAGVKLIEWEGQIYSRIEGKQHGQQYMDPPYDKY